MLVTNFVGCLCAVIAAVALMSGATNITIACACFGFGCGIATIYERLIP